METKIKMQGKINYEELQHHIQADSMCELTKDRSMCHVVLMGKLTTTNDDNDNNNNNNMNKLRRITEDYTDGHCSHPQESSVDLLLRPCLF